MSESSEFRGVFRLRARSFSMNRSRHYGYDYYMGTITARDSNINPVLEKDGSR